MLAIEMGNLQRRRTSTGGAESEKQLFELYKNAELKVSRKRLEQRGRLILLMQRAK
ncbi:hypothetical protein ACNKHR_25860 [Shigella flexneri]